MDGSGSGPWTDALALTCLAIGVGLVIGHRRGIARVLWRDEDPRTMAAFRIATGLCTMAWALDLWPLVEYLFSDEGLFLTDTARQTLASESFAGLADGTAPNEPPAWIGVGAVVHWLAGHKFSPLFFWDSPAAAWTVWGALVVAAFALVLGWQTTVAKWATAALMIALVDRNPIFLAGEQVLLNALLVVCCARCGAAYSLDARRRPLVSIPAWPRVLGVLTTLPLFFVNGLAKTGDGWVEGSTLHYLLSNPDFARVDPSWISSTIALYVLRPATWAAHLLELMFPLVVVGTVLRWHRQTEGASAPLGRGVRLGWLLLAACAWLLADASFEPHNRHRLSGAVVSAAVIVVVIAAIAGPWLRRVVAPSVRNHARQWLLGRRVWISLQVTFSAGLIIGADLGWFVPLTLATALLFFDGDEIDRVISRLRRIPQRAVVRGPPPTSRFAAAWFLAWHITAATAAQLPHATETSPWRASLEQPLRRWIAFAHTWQGYRMFAPNGPTAAFDLEVEQVDAQGRAWIIGDGLAPRTPRLFGWGRDKSHKTVWRMITADLTAWYRKWHGRWLCRDRALHDGRLPEMIRLLRVRHTMPTPQGTPAGPIERTVIWEGQCADEIHGQPDPAVRARHDLMLPERFVPWPKPRAHAWAQRTDAPDWPWVPTLVLGPVAAAGLLARRRRAASEQPTKTGTP